MNLYARCTTDGSMGPLISLALAPEDASPPFYEVVAYEKISDDWTADNVIPVLERDPKPLQEVGNTLRSYLQDRVSDTIISDDPKTIAYLVALLAKGSVATFKLVSSGDLRSAVPNNALEDAIALRNWCMTL